MNISIYNYISIEQKIGYMVDVYGGNAKPLFLVHVV